MKYTLIALLATAAPALAVTTFTENFDSDNAFWDRATRGVAATHVSTGGADGGGYITNNLDFSANTPGMNESISVIRGEVEAPNIASGGAFVGNWIADGVSTFSVSVRHDSTVPLTFFARFADPNNFPGAIAVNFAPVFANTWTELSFSIDANNPQFVSFEGQTFESVFDNIGDIQIGVSVPDALAGNTDSFTFDVDSASVVVVDSVPEPSTSLLALLGLGFLARRKRA